MVVEHDCPEKWVEIVENHSENKTENKIILKENLDILLNENVEKIILGCTHYPYLKDILTNFVGKDIFIDPSEYFSNYIFENLKELNLLNENKKYEPKFYVSSNPEKFKKSSEIFYKMETLPTLVDKI